MIDRVPLEFPLYGAKFGEAASRFRRKLFVFSGRASRSEFWWAYLVDVIISTVVMVVIMVVWMILLFVSIGGMVSSADSDSGPSVASTGAVFGLTFGLYGVIIVVAILIQLPLLGVMARRLHDAGFTALWLLLLLVPYGGYAVLVMCILDSKPAGARYDTAPGGPILYPPTLVPGPAYTAPVDPYAQPAAPYAAPYTPPDAPPAAPPPTS